MEAYAKIWALPIGLCIPENREERDQTQTQKTEISFSAVLCTRGKRKQQYQKHARKDNKYTLLRNAQKHTAPLSPRTLHFCHLVDLRYYSTRHMEDGLLPHVII